MSKSKNLIMAAVGDNSLHRHWLNKKEFDCFLIYYGNNKGYEGETAHYRRAKGNKFHVLKDTLDDNPWIFDYEYVWLPDDDIIMKPNAVSRLFQMMKQYDLWLAQPSIMGWYGVEITLHRRGSLLRYTNWIEIMCPCFSSEALRKCCKVFKENKSGWSTEMIWNVLLGHPRDKIAIIDDIIAIHTRQVLTGDAYREKETALKEAMKEALETYNKWDLGSHMKADLGEGTAVGSEIHCATMYGQLFKGTEGNVPHHERFWPPLHELKSFIDDFKRNHGDIANL